MILLMTLFESVVHSVPMQEFLLSSNDLENLEGGAMDKSSLLLRSSSVSNPP